MTLRWCRRHVWTYESLCMCLPIQHKHVNIHCKSTYGKNSIEWKPLWMAYSIYAVTTKLKRRITPYSGSRSTIGRSCHEISSWISSNSEYQGSPARHTSEYEAHDPVISVQQRCEDTMRLSRRRLTAWLNANNSKAVFQFNTIIYYLSFNCIFGYKLLHASVFLI